MYRFFERGLAHAVDESFSGRQHIHGHVSAFADEPRMEFGERSVVGLASDPARPRIFGGVF